MIEKLGEEITTCSYFHLCNALLHTKKLSYKIVHGMKLKLPIDVALQPLQSTHMPAVGDYVQELQVMW